MFISKRIKWILKKATLKKKFCIVECYKDFFGYFNALETHGALGLVCIHTANVEIGKANWWQPDLHWVDFPQGAVHNTVNIYGHIIGML